MAFSYKTHKDPSGVADTIHELLELPETGACLAISDTDIKSITIETNHATVNYIKIWDNPNPTLATDPPDWLVPIVGLATKMTIDALFEDCSTNGLYVIATTTKNSGNTSANITQVAPNGLVNVWIVTTP